MKLITELNTTLPTRIITEAKENGAKELFIEGVFIECDIVNNNGRLYPLDLIKQVVEKYVKDKVSTNRAYGELNHPNNLEITPDRISHRIVELRQEGSNFIGKAHIANTPCGNIVRGLIEGGGQLAVSTRGAGNIVKKNGVSVVDKDYQLITAGDIVIDPSAPSAFVNGIMEGREWVYNNGAFKEITKYKKDINQIVKENKYNRNDRALAFANLLEKYIKNL